jgi:hypothetical protein
VIIGIPSAAGLSDIPWPTMNGRTKKSAASSAGSAPDFQAPESSDGHRPTLQAEIGLSGDDDTTPDNAAPVILDWPAELPAQDAAIRKLLPTIGQDPESLAACFGRKNKQRTDQITGILATLKALGHIV